MKIAYPTYEFLNSLDLDLDVRRRLPLNLNNILVGDDVPLLTPIAKDNNVDSLFLEFDKVFESNRDKMNKVLIDLELSNKSRVGPRSLAIPWSERKSSLTDSFKSSTHNIPEIEAPFPKGNLRPLSLNNALKLLKNDTNSGLPYYTRKGKVKERVLNKFDMLLNRKYPCVLFTRTQEQRKTRNVWGFPIADTLNEMRYYSPLLEYQRKLDWRAAIVSPEMVNRRLTEIIISSLKRKETIVSIDFSAYDTTVKTKLQKYAFEYISNLFQPQFRSEIDYIFKRFNTIAIVTPDGILSGEHGVPSGSTFTNEVDSIVQRLISLNSKLVDENKMQVQGDDGVYSVQNDLKADDLLSYFESYGLNVNRDKSYRSDNYAIYLQNLYHIDYMHNNYICGIYPVYRALNRIFYQERWSNFEDYDIMGKDYYSIRTICILENCKYHPLFKELVKFIIKYDKYALDVSDQGISKYVQMFNDTRGAGGILFNQYGDNVSGIRSFDSFKLIKELS